MTFRDVEQAATLDIRLVIDLRGERATGSGPLAKPSARRIAVGPVFEANPSADFLALREAKPDEALPKVLDIYGPSFAEALNAIATQPGTNVLFHCRLGKDRTGVFAALLLNLLGVSDNDIIKDYMYTADSEAYVRHHLSRVQPLASQVEPRVAREPPGAAAIEAVLVRLRLGYGGAHAYLAGQGLDGRSLDAIIGDFLEPQT